MTVLMVLRNEFDGTTITLSKQSGTAHVGPYFVKTENESPEISGVDVIEEGFHHMSDAMRCFLEYVNVEGEAVSGEFF